MQFLPEAPGGPIATRFLVARRLNPALEFVCGHMLPIEPMAQSFADQVLDWLDHQGL